MGSRGNCNCCDPNCSTFCADVDKPLEVTFTVPYATDGGGPTEQTFGLTNIGSIDGPCSVFQANLACARDTNWSVLEDRTCQSDWPASNPNDDAWAVGTLTGCTQCSGYYPSTYKRYYEETQVFGRTTVWRRLSYVSYFRIEPFGTAGLLRLSYQVSYGEALASTQVIGARNRVKIITITCDNSEGIVTDLSDWVVADAPTLPTPNRCVAATTKLCLTELDTSSLYNGSCDENPTAIAVATIGCTSVPILLQTSVGTPWCNIPPTSIDFIACDFLSSGGTLVNINGQATSGAADRFVETWSAVVDCHDLYDGPIVLTGGPASGTFELPFFGTPAIDAGLGRCEFTGSYGSRLWAVPETISVVLSH
jgi:hypothetical protein